MLNDLDSTEYEKHDVSKGCRSVKLTASNFVTMMSNSEPHIARKIVWKRTGVGDIVRVKLTNDDFHGMAVLLGGLVTRRGSA